MPPPRLKRSNTAGQAPSSLEDGEIAINQADGKLYYHTAAGGVSTFLTSAHKSTHATGGSDALSAADIGALTQTAADARYVELTGDTMSGGLTVNAGTPLTASGGRSFFAAASEPYGVGVKYVSSGGAVYFGATDGTATPGAQISKAGGVALMSFTNAGAASIPGTLSVGGVAVVVTTDSRLSDSRAPLAHTQAASTITDFATEAGKYGPVVSVNGLTGAVTIATSSPVSDGSKGDITVSGSGATWTINANAVVTADIAGSAVTYAKIQNVSATDRLLGRSTAGAGVVEEITCTAFGRSVIAGADASAVRTTLNAVSKGGDTISGAVTVTGALTGQTGLAISGGRSLFRAVNEPYGVGSAYGTGGGYVYFGAAAAHSTPDAVISNAGGAGLMTLQNGGNVGIGTASPAVKLDVSGVARASSGIRFGADTAAANTLSDYEEGTWTPAFVTGFSSVTMSSATGQYIKIGKAVTAHIRLGVSAFTGNGSAVGISLPFTASAATVGGGFVHYSTAFATGAVSAPMLYGPDSSSSTATLIKANSEGFTASDFKTPGWTIGFTVLYTAD
jgi:hypothetical protein